MADDELLRLPPVGVDWQPLSADDQVMAVCLMINVPEYATVARNTETGQVMFDNLLPADLVSLRDALNGQIEALASRWSPL